MATTNIDEDSVMTALQSEKFDIGENSYSVMASISNYTASIYAAVEALRNSFSSAVSEVEQYISNFKYVPEPTIDPRNESSFLDEEPVRTVSRDSSKDVRGFVNSETNSIPQTNQSEFSGVVDLKGESAYLTLRSTPSMSSQNIIGQINQGDIVTIIGEENGFYKIRLSTGAVAYVPKEFISTENLINSLPTNAIVRLGNNNIKLNLRSEPNKNSNNIIDSINNNTVLEVLNRTGNWTKVNYNGQEGWVITDYLDR